METPLTATLEDGDGGVTNAAWQWARSDNGRTGWVTISGATTSRHTPTEDDEAFYLRARVTYTDRRGGGKSAEAITALPVPSDNRRPSFPSYETGRRTVPENTRANVNIGAPVAALDPENDRLTYSLGGPDDSAFTILTGSGQLRTKDALDFETGSSYSVTVEVHDGRDGAGNASTNIDGTQMVDISVENVEEPGTVTLTTLTGTIQASVQVTAELSDGDGPFGMSWQWSRSPNGRTGWVNIAGAGSATYTPTLTDIRNYIRATVSYGDGHGAGKTASAVSSRVGDPPPVNSAPVFPATEDGRREVPEDAAGGTAIGSPVAATDLNAGDSAVNDPLVYSMTGTDAASFTIDAGTGQISLAPDVQLDYEGKRTHRLTVRVTDGRDQNGEDDMDAVDDTINVTVTVTNVNEAPEVAGETDPSVPENTRSPVASYSARDPERDQVAWSVDNDDFWVSDRGQLYFSAPPSFEAGSTRQVNVTATDDNEGGSLSGSVAVTVSVTDVEEPGTIVITPPRGWADPQTQFSAALTDDDGGVTGTTWQWARSSNRSGWTDIEGATSQSYTAGPDDANQYLRVTAGYEDRRSSNKAASAQLKTRVGDTGPAANAAPEFASESATRSITAGTAPGRSVGPAVRATDSDQGDVLTYSLGGTDAASFDIDASTGQIRTRTVLVYDRSPDAENTYGVTVSVHDGFDGSYNPSTIEDDTIVVTISVTARPPAPPPGGSPPPPPAVSCVEDLGALVAEQTATETGAWVADCDSTNRSGSYARFYTFTLEQETEVSIDLESSVDAYLYLLQGAGEDGDVLHQNGDAAEGDTDSRIVATLVAGGYTVEATTDEAGTTGDFTLRVSVAEPPPADPCVTPLGTLTAAATQSGSWADDCESTNREGSYARFYSFILEQETEVSIDLESSVDAYLYLLQGAGEDGDVLHQNGDAAEGDTDSRIVATLVAGGYTVEATTDEAGTTGDFTLRVSVAEPPPADPCVTPLGTLTAAATQSGSWADDCESANREGSYARFYTFTLEQETEVSIDLTSSQDTYLFLLQGSGRDGTVAEENDDLVSGNTDSRVVATLAAGAYTVEATTYTAGATGDFTLTITGPAGAAEPPILPADPCVPPLGTLTAAATQSGAWADDCESANREGSYARFYTFTLD